MPGKKKTGGTTSRPPKKRPCTLRHKTKLNNELFSEAFQYFTRLEAEDLRLTCRMFNELAGQLCDVFGYKLQLYRLSVAKGTEKHTVSIEVRGREGHEISFEGSEEEAMARLKGAVRVASVRHCEINATAISKRLCGLFVDACTQTTFCDVLLVNDVSLFDRQKCEMDSAALQNFLLSLNIRAMLDVRGLFRRGDFTRDFLLQCKENGIQTLRGPGLTIDLQRMQPEQVEGIVQAIQL